MTRFENRREEETSLDACLAMAHRKNPKEHKLDELIESFVRFGFIACPTVDESTKTMVAGHGRCLALKKMRDDGFAAPNGVRVIGDDWRIPLLRGIYFESEKERDAYVLADNQHTIASGWDLDKLVEFAAGIGTSAADFKGLGFESDELESFGVIGDEANSQHGTSEDDANSGRFDDAGLPDQRDEKPKQRETMIVETELPSEADKPTTRTKLGDVIKLGKHVLVCGDSTLDAIERAVDFFDDGTDECTAADVALVVTDPPWNVAVLGGRRDDSAEDRRARGNLDVANDDLGVDFPVFVENFMRKITEECDPGVPMYLAMSGREWGIVDSRIRAAGWRASTPIMWGKNSWILGRGDYHSQYEPFWYGWRDGAPRLCPVEDRTQGDLWMTDRPKPHKRHPTTKPVALLARMIRNSSRAGDLVLDPFGGSGSTLIACEQLGRRCAMVELSTVHCDDIVERFESLTGIKAEYQLAA